MITNEEYASIISSNLKDLMDKNQKTQSDISHDLKLNKMTVSSWVNGKRIPKMDKIDLLANYFRVSRSAIMNPPEEQKKEDKIPPILIECYTNLNDEGRERLLEYVRMLTRDGGFTK